MESHRALQAVVDLALAQDGVVSRAQARACGMDRWAVAHQVSSGRWKAYGDRSVAVHPMPLDARAAVRVSAWEASEQAVVDGATSLVWQGLARWQDRAHLIVPWPSGGRSWNGAAVHSSRLWRVEDFHEVDGLRVTRPAVAAVRAAMWARSDRAAATVMAMAVQQRLVEPTDLVLEARRLNRHKRRPLILAVAGDISDGAQSLSELDFMGICRRAGLPEPSRQVLRRGPKGRVYLDVFWDEYGVVVEVEGAHHDAPENVLDDSVRQNHLAIAQLGVLRIPVIGLRTMPGAFLAQVDEMLRVKGWRRAA